MNGDHIFQRVDVVPTAASAASATFAEEEEKQNDTAVFLPVEEDIFGTSSSDDDTDDEDESRTNLSTIQNHRLRNDDEFGILKFHAGTEQAMLLFVKEQFSKQDQQTAKDEEYEDKTNHLQQLARQSYRILHWIDEYCMTRHWMMHVGPEKGRILQEFLIQRFQTWYANRRTKTTTTMHSPSPPFRIVELGTYCAYSTIRMAQAILFEYAANTSSYGKNADFHIYTVDIQSQTVAQQLVEIAGLSRYITFIQRPSKTSETDDLSELLRPWITTSSTHPKIDFLFIDHAKELYLSDMMQLERSQLLQAESAVIADNVVFFGINEYRQHMAELQNHRDGIVHTRLVSENIYLEYAARKNPNNHEDPPRNDKQQKDRKAQDLQALGDGLGTLQLVEHGATISALVYMFFQ